MENISIDKAIATSAAPSAMKGYGMIAFGGLAERFFPFTYSVHCNRNSSLARF